MKKISSKYQIFYKRIFPAIWFGGLGLWLLQAVRLGAFEKQPFILVGPFIMAFFGFRLMKKLIWDLADEVYDCGEYLLVKMKGEEDSVQLTNVMNVSATTNSSPRRITLRLINPSKFGPEISFSPIAGFFDRLSTKNVVVEDLMVRVDAARAKRESILFLIGQALLKSLCPYRKTCFSFLFRLSIYQAVQ
jgi:hypothetical protein